MKLDLRVISIGTLPTHPLWNEHQPTRTGHATTTLIRSDDRVILVDPGLPERALRARLDERSGLSPGDITDVFLTSFKGDTCRGIGLFDQARWWVAGDEREGVGVPLAILLRDADDPQVVAELQRQVAILNRCEPAPDRLAPHVDLFPLPGVTPGLCGLLIGEPLGTTLICGDAAATIEHLQHGSVLPHAHDVDQARRSLAEAIEIADLLVLGRDNIVTNPSRGPF